MRHWCPGERVLGVRAPTFSISDEVLDTLAQCGYGYDSSYFALRGHDRYGRLTTPIDSSRDVVEVRPGLLELPMSSLGTGPTSIPWAGGGYLLEDLRQLRREFGSLRIGGALPALVHTPPPA